MNLTPDMLRKIRRIELRTRRLVNASFAGVYQSVFKGRGIEFEAVQPYVPGDDVRAIDWNVTARLGEPYVKRYVEERELTVLLLIDVSASCFFGTSNQRKRDVAVELGAVLAYSAIRNHDRVGMLLFSDRVERYVPPHRGRDHILHLIRDLLAFKPARSGTDIVSALQTVERLARRRAIVFLISDFLVGPPEYARELALVSRRHDLIAVVLSDPREADWPDVGLVRVRDAETGHESWIDTGSVAWRLAFRQQTGRFRSLRDETLLSAGVDRIVVPTDGDYVTALARFFQTRLSRTRGR